MTMLLDESPYRQRPRCIRRVPASHEQRGLWFIHQADPDCGAYHLTFSAEVEASGGDVHRAMSILKGMTAEHAALRVSFAGGDSGPEQLVWDSVAPAIEITDARGLGGEALRRLIRSGMRRPFDLARPPLWRVQLYRTGASRWVVACVAHHIILDFWSLGLLLRSFVEQLNGLAETMKPDGDAFADHAGEQTVRIADETNRATWLGYWRKQLAGIPATLNLPLDRPRPALMTHSGGSVPFRLSASASEGVRQLAKQAGATPFMCLLAAYQILLSRYSGEQDVVVGSPVANRQKRRLRTALGNFVNTVALRSRIEPDISYLDLLAAVRGTVIDAIRHQDCPFPWLVEQIAPRRDPSVTPVYQAGFAWERLPLMEDFADFFLAEPAAVERVVEGFRLTPYPLPQQEGQLDLTLEMGGEQDGAFCGAFKFNTDLFKSATIAEMSASFKVLIETLVERPGIPLGDLPLTTPAQEAALLFRGRGIDLDLPDTGLFDLIAAQALRTPSRRAVTDGVADWSYADLIEAAEEIADRLQRMGVKPGDRVGLMIERGNAMLAALLGILRAGAAYVPLDPAFPADRLAHVAGDAGLGALLTHSTLRPLWPAGVPVCCVDGERIADPAPMPVAADPAACAYILYTSGSTGKPKGVRVSNWSVVNFLLAMRRELGIDETARLLAVTTISFDIAVLELYLPLTVGGQVVICDRETAADGHALAERIDASDATWMQATPATWRMLTSAGWAGKGDLSVLCGGEALSPALAQALLPLSAALWNVYGPTETTVWSTCGRVLPGDLIGLGSPIANTRLYVLDGRRRLVPPGVMGELYIGGDGVAMDYWNRPDLTAERFLPELPFDPGSGPGGGRVYRTGDRVRWSADGRLEHHGRFDHQIKLRGYRIELGEIETVLRGQALVQDAVVLVREDRPGDQKLVAYVLTGADKPSVSDLRAALKEVLPSYMMPSAFVPLDRFPQTPNNKIDRNALPAPAEDLAGDTFVAPRDAVEIELARIWSELLGLTRVGIHDNFFDLGGHSLLAVQLMTAIRREWGCELPVSELLQHGTIAELALRLRDDGGAGDAKAVVSLRKGDDGTAPLFLFHPIGGNVFCYLELVRQLKPGRPVAALQAPGLDADGEAEVSIEAMARRYLAEIRGVQSEGPYLLGGWCFGGIVAFEAARQLRAAGEEIAGIVLFDTRAPILENVPSDGDDATLLSWFARDLATPFDKVLDIPPTVLRDLPPDAMFDHVLDAARGIGVMPVDADRGRMQRYFEVYLANGIALQGYLPDSDELDVTLFLARDEKADYGPALGWDKLAPGRLDLIQAPGDHNSIMYAPNAAEIATEIDGRFPPCFLVKD